MPHAKHIAETHARVGLFVHDAASLCRRNYCIDAGFGPTNLSRSSRWLFGTLMNLWALQLHAIRTLSQRNGYGIMTDGMLDLRRAG
jgi:hypothetical protein